MFPLGKVWSHIQLLYHSGITKLLYFLIFLQLLHYFHFSYFTVLQAIEERREFLQEMEQLGQGKQYRTMIETEISQVWI